MTDPHFRSFDNQYFDFQSGCKVVAAQNDKIDIHLRLEKKSGYSAINAVGLNLETGATVEIDETAAVIVNGGTPLSPGFGMLNLGGGYELYEYPSTGGNGNPGSGTYKVFLPVDGYDSGTFFVSVDVFSYSQQICGGGNCPKGEEDCDRETRKDIANAERNHDFNNPDLPGGNNTDDCPLYNYGYMSFRIQGHGSIFEGSKGICGDWNESDPSDPSVQGFNDRDSNPIPQEGVSTACITLLIACFPIFFVLLKRFYYSYLS